MNKHTRRTITLTETWTMTWEAAGYAPMQTSVSPLSKALNLYAHWDAFPSNQPIGDVLPVAEWALVQVGLQIYSPALHDKYIVTGGNANLMVIVICIPEGEQSWVVVYAAAPDSVVAEQARNAIRAAMVKAAFFA